MNTFGYVLNGLKMGSRYNTSLFEISRFFLWFFAAVFLAEGRAAADDGPLRVGGYVKGFLTVLDPARVEGTAGSVGGVYPIRLKAFWQPNRTVSGEVAYALTPQVRKGQRGFSGTALPRPESLSYRGADLRAYLYPGLGKAPGTFALAQNLDRVFFTVSLPAADVYLGRQPIAFGSARVVNPTDVIAPFTYEALDNEERAGVDALRVRLPVGAMGELDAGVVFGDGFSVKTGAAFLRGRFYLMETDLLLMAMVFKEHLLLGVDLARAVGGAGAWLEAAWTLAEAAGGSRLDEDYVRISGGLDYQFSGGVYGFVEYHFSGAGASGAYPGVLNKTAFTEGGVYLMGRHYVAPGFTYQATPLLTLSLQALANIGDGSAFLAPRVGYSFAEDVFATAGVFIGMGPGGMDGRIEVERRSEFRLYPTLYFGSLRFYF